MEFVYPILIFVVMGIVFGVLLVVISKVFAVKTDERAVQITEALPGANCGACGYAGCADYADAIVNKGAPMNACLPGGANAAAAIGAIMGQEAGAQERRKAVVRCAGTCDVAKNKYEYTGARDCSYAGFVPGGGPKSCGNGCLGFGNCVKACKFDAIHIENGIAAPGVENYLPLFFDETETLFDYIGSDASLILLDDVNSAIEHFDKETEQRAKFLRADGV